MTTAFYINPSSAHHTLPNHPEHAGRLQAILDHFQALHLTERFLTLPDRTATRDELLRVHTPNHLATLPQLTTHNRPVMIGADTYFLPPSYDIATQAVGGVLNLIDSLLTGQADNGLAAIRPPGHHATPNQAMGFCLLNNIALAARHAQAVHGLKKIAIVDFDVHHGNGTQDAFYTDPNVLFISSHQSPLYPGTGHLTEIGQGDGQGTTLNIPLPSGTGDSSFLALYDQIAFPALRRFQPQLILVSAGFDAHWRDPLANLEISLTAFAQLAHQLYTLATELCGGKIIFVMEGGYDTEVLSNGMTNLAHILLGDDTRHDPIGKSLRDKPIDALIERLRKIHQIL